MVSFHMQYEVILLDPARDFVRDLGEKLQAKVLRTIDFLAYFGPQLAMPHAKKLSGYDLWELRVGQAGTICRLFVSIQLEYRTNVKYSGGFKTVKHSSPWEGIAPAGCRA
jgi:hypothetical protein